MHDVVCDIQIEFVPSVNFLSLATIYDAQGIELTSQIYLPPCMHALHNFPNEVSTERAFVVHYIYFKEY